MQAKAAVETDKKDRERIIVSELPYQVNKAQLIEKIAELVRDKKMEGITDLRDESDRDGMRIVIEVSKNMNAQVVLNNLLTQTSLRTSFGIIMLALVNGQPRVLNLKGLLYHYLEHRKEVVIRRTKFDLDKAEKRAHILGGLAHRHRQPGQGHQDHPRQQVHRRSQGGPDRVTSSFRPFRPRRSWKCNCAN